MALLSGSSWHSRKLSLPQRLAACMVQWPGRRPGEPGQSLRHLSLVVQSWHSCLLFVCLFVLGMKGRALGMLTSAILLSCSWLCRHHHHHDRHHHHQISFLWHGLIQSKLPLDSLNSWEWFGTPDPSKEWNYRHAPPSTETGVLFLFSTVIQHASFPILSHMSIHLCNFNQGAVSSLCPYTSRCNSWPCRGGWMAASTHCNDISLQRWLWRSA